jgi:hypothetical protein
MACHTNFVNTYHFYAYGMINKSLALGYPKHSAKGECDIFTLGIKLGVADQ